MNSNWLTTYFRLFLPNELVWKVKTTRKEIFLTFDDGPTGDLTMEILEILDRFDAKATFFCVGDNVSRYPEIYREMLGRGHNTGNHTYHHLKGWKTKTTDYVGNVYRATELIPSRLFRPPYGKITYSQVTSLKKDYRIVMWTLLSMDYDRDVSAEKSLDIVLKGISPGSIVVFHDNLKAADKVRHVLPRFLQELRDRDYRCLVLPGQGLDGIRI